MTTPPTGKTFPLFGFPISHSAAPAFHNHCFASLASHNEYSLWSTSQVTDEMLQAIHSPDCGGAAVTMPLKAAILPYLDEISEESRLTNACNTIVKVPSPSSPRGYKLVAQNTDILGVRNALLSALRSQHPNAPFPSGTPAYAPGVGAALIIGGGATTRSSAQALTLLGLAPIYLINRDEEEIRAVMDGMPHLTAQGALIHLKNTDDVERELVGPSAKRILMAVGCIPAFAPITPAERMVYTTVTAVLTVPYDRPTSSTLPAPTKRLFLEMPYKPRITPMYKIADALGWAPIVGVQAMIEQALAQQRMWLRSVPTVEVGSDPDALKRAGPEGGDVEAEARALTEGMEDVPAPAAKEVDRAAGRAPAVVSAWKT